MAQHTKHSADTRELIPALAPMSFISSGIFAALIVAESVLHPNPMMIGIAAVFLLLGAGTFLRQRWCMVASASLAAVILALTIVGWITQGRPQAVFLVAPPMVMIFNGLPYLRGRPPGEPGA